MLLQLGALVKCLPSFIFSYSEKQLTDWSEAEATNSETTVLIILYFLIVKLLGKPAFKALSW